MINKNMAIAVIIFIVVVGGGLSILGITIKPQGIAIDNKSSLESRIKVLEERMRIVSDAVFLKYEGDDCPDEFKRLVGNCGDG